MNKWYEEQYKRVWVQTQVHAPFIFSVSFLRRKWKIKVAQSSKISDVKATIKYEKFLAKLTEKSERYLLSSEVKQLKPIIDAVLKLNQTEGYKQRVIAELMSNAPALRFERDIETFTKIFGFTEDWSEPFALYIVTNCKMIPSAPSYIEYNMRPIRKNIKQMIDAFHLDVFRKLQGKDKGGYDIVGKIDIAEAVYGSIPSKLEGTEAGRKKEQAILSKLRKDKERFLKDDHLVILTEDCRKDLTELFS